MSTAPKQHLIDIHIPALLEWMQRGEAVLVDVREPEEYAEEHIPGSVALPLSRFDAGALPTVPCKRTVLTCFIGGRSTRAAERLFAAGHCEAMHLDGGLFGWKEAGFATDRGPANVFGRLAEALGA